jgi:hypothetical protein|tara:strand:+ start:38447 stop:39031 length:585 start_codon:yes stop_codon:yes gene_type:complete
MANLFKNLEIEAFRAGITPRTKESREWFRKRLASMGKINQKELMTSDSVKLANKQLVGSMQMFYYQAKHRDKLPYFDAFPLVIVLGPAEKGFLGMNLHYLPPPLRAKFLDALMDITTNKKYNESTRFDVTYDMLKGAAKYKYFKPCVKHYLTAQVRSKFARIPAPEWEIATFLPTASWQGGSASQVYKDSKGMI